MWEIVSGYFGTRTKDGDFDPRMFAETAAHPSVKCLSLKLSPGAKPSLGGVLPVGEVTAEIAKARNMQEGVQCVSSAAHKVFQHHGNSSSSCQLCANSLRGNPWGSNSVWDHGQMF